MRSGAVSPSPLSTCCALELIGILYGTASERRLCKHIEYNLLFRWFVGLPFGWMKAWGGLRKLRHRGLTRVQAIFTWSCSAFNRLRLRKLGAEAALA